jgi:DNA repair protein RecO (recombination protein O)
MPVTTTAAVILGSVRLGEANRLMTFLTPGRGRLSGMAYNVRRPNRRFGSALDLFTHSELVMAERRPHHQIDLRQAAILQGFPAIRGDLGRIEAAGRLAMLCRAFLPEAAPHPVAFDLLVGALAALHEGRPAWLTLRLFEVGLLRDVGYEPRLDRCVRCQREWRGQRAAGTLFFSPPGGGLLCRRCAGRDADRAQPFPVLPAAVAFVRQAGRLGLDRGGRLRPSAPVCRDVESLLRRYLRVLLERQPFSHRLDAPWLVAETEAPVAVNISPSPASISCT